MQQLDLFSVFEKASPDTIPSGNIAVRKTKTPTAAQIPEPDPLPFTEPVPERLPDPVPEPEPVPLPEPEPIPAPEPEPFPKPEPAPPAVPEPEPAPIPPPEPIPMPEPEPDAEPEPEPIPYYEPEPDNSPSIIGNAEEIITDALIEEGEQDIIPEQPETEAEPGQMLYHGPEQDSDPSVAGSTEKIINDVLTEDKEEEANDKIVVDEQDIVPKQPEESDTASSREDKNVKDKEVLRPSGKRGRMSFKEMDAELVMVEVPDDELLFQKQYYSMGEVAKWFHVNQSLLRYWENEFDVLKPRKTRKGDRLFRPEDIKNLQLIYFLLRHRKFSIEGTKQYLKDNRHKADLHMQLIQSLTKLRSFLLEVKANLEA